MKTAKIPTAEKTNETDRLQENLSVTVASLPALRLLPATIANFQTCESDAKPQSETGAATSSSTPISPNDDAQHTIHEELESNTLEMTPVKAIEITRSVDVAFAPRGSGGLAEPNVWEHKSCARCHQLRSGS